MLPVVFGSTGPFFLVNLIARPFVAWVYLILPPHARQSPRTALEYSKNFPRDALLQIWFMRATALTGQIEAKIADLVPRRGFWPPATFEWVGRSAQGLGSAAIQRASLSTRGVVLVRQRGTRYLGFWRMFTRGLCA
jgi:hypothetical protein